MRVSSPEPGPMVIGRMCDPRSSVSGTSFASSTGPLIRSKTTPPSGTAGRSQTEVNQHQSGLFLIANGPACPHVAGRLAHPLSQRTPSVADLVKDALKRRQVGHDEMARGLLDANNGCWIALRRRNKRPAELIDRLQISVARKECHGADRLFGLPAIRITTFPA